MVSNRFFACQSIVLAVCFETPVCSAISSRLSSSLFMRMILCSEGVSRPIACSRVSFCSCCRRGASAASPFPSQGGVNVSVCRSLCLLQTLTHRFFVALISRASMLSPLRQPRSSIRTQTSCTTSSASSRFWKNLMATHIILSRVWRSKCSNSVCVICLYNARHREMSSKKEKNFSKSAPTACCLCRNSQMHEAVLCPRR